MWYDPRPTDSRLLRDAKEEYVKVLTAIEELRQNGQKYQLNGSHGFEGVSYAELKRDEAKAKARVIRLLGVKATVYPDFQDA